MKKRRMQIDVPALFQLWNDSSLEIREIAQKLDCSTTKLISEARLRGLSSRERASAVKSFCDNPTPDQIAEYERRKEEVRQKHFADMRSKA